MRCDSGRVSTPRPEPTRGLSDRAVGLWTLGALGWSLPAVLGVLALAGSVGVPGWLFALLVVLCVAGVVIAAGIVPRVRKRRWRWEVRDEEIDLRHGAFTEIRTIVPMSRVGHLRSSRFPW